MHKNAQGGPVYLEVTINISVCLVKELPVRPIVIALCEPPVLPVPEGFSVPAKFAERSGKPQDWRLQPALYAVPNLRVYTL